MPRPILCIEDLSLKTAMPRVKQQQVNLRDYFLFLSFLLLFKFFIFSANVGLCSHFQYKIQ